MQDMANERLYNVGSGGQPFSTPPPPRVEDRPTGGGPTELSLLAGAVNQTFEATANLPTESVLSLLSALGEVSARCLPAQVRVP